MRYSEEDERRLRSEWLPSPPPPIEEHHWEAAITRTRIPFMWSVDFTKGLIGFPEWPLFPTIGTRRRAEAVTRRRLRRLERSDQRARDKTIITGGSYGC